MLNLFAYRLCSRLVRMTAMWACLTIVFFAYSEDFQGSTHKVPYEDEVIDYDHRVSSDRVAQLQRKLENGEIRLRFDPKSGYLKAILEALEVPKSSQMLVFSKTSLQRHSISPSNPRAIFYNDDVYVGFIPGAPLMEISAVDSNLGGVFYTLEQTEKQPPKLLRSTECLQCHGGAKTLGVPGHLVRSVATDETGELDSQNEVSGITHCTPVEDRWAGWYVTGTHGQQTHRGNLIGKAAFQKQAEQPNYFGNLADLSRFFDVTKYPEAGSDIVALMILEHQAHMHNYVTRLNFEALIKLKQYGHVRYLKTPMNAFLRYLLFAEEALLTSELRGNPEFVKRFTARGLKDKQGRSLRDLDLQTRLFKYPCSFLIYSPAFDNMPTAVRDQLLERLYDILTGKDQSPDFAKLRTEDRENILEILRDTKGNLPDYWRRPIDKATNE